MQIRLALAVAALAVFPIACKSKQEVVVPKEDVPREIAVSKLRELLPQATEIYCTFPKESLKQSEIRSWHIGADGLELRPTKAKPLLLNYADITGTKVEKSGAKVYVKLYTSVQKDPNKEHFTFVWGTEEAGTGADQLFESLRKK